MKTTLPEAYFKNGVITGSQSSELVSDVSYRLSRYYKTLYGNKYRVCKIVVNWCKRHK